MKNVFTRTYDLESNGLSTSSDGTPNSAVKLEGISQIEWKREEKPTLSNSTTSNTAITSDTKQAPDGGWGWVVVICGLLILAIDYGIVASWGLLYPDIQDKYDLSLTSASWLGSIFAGIGFIAGPFISHVLQRFGHRITGSIAVTLLSVGFISSMFITNSYVIFITSSIVPGMGHGILYFATLSIVTEYFDKKRPIALALTMVGGAGGTMGFPPLISFFITEYTLWGTFLLLGGIILNQYWCILTFRPLRHKALHHETKSNKSESTSYLSFLADVRSLLLLLSELLMCVSGFLFPSFIPTIAAMQVQGLSLTQTSFLVSINGVTGLIGRLVSGVLTTILHNYTVQMFIVSACMCGTLLSVTTLCSSYLVLMLVSGAYGFFNGCVIALQPNVYLKVFGTQGFTRLYGMVLFMGGVGLLTGAPLASWLAELLGDPRALFYTGTAAFVLSALMLVPLTLMKRPTGGEVAEVKVNPPKDSG